MSKLYNKKIASKLIILQREDKNQKKKKELKEFKYSPQE